MEQSAIRLKNLGLSIGGRRLLKDIEWTIEPGSRWVVFGGNGSGKTTLLSVLAGYCSYDGSFTVGDKNFEEIDCIDWRKRTGFVSGSYFGRIYKNETVQTVLLSGARGTLGVPADSIHPSEIWGMHKLLACRNLEHRLDSDFSSLSKGEQQSVLIMRALLANPDFCLLDEPLSGLDVGGRLWAQGVVRTLAAQRNATIVFVSHRLDEVPVDLFDHCLFLSQGRVAEVGATKEVLATKAVEQFMSGSIYPVQ